MQIKTIEFHCNTSADQLQALTEAIRIAQFIRNKTLAAWQLSKTTPYELKNENLLRYANLLAEDYVFTKKIGKESRRLAGRQAQQIISNHYKSGQHSPIKFKNNLRSIQYGAKGWNLNEACTELSILKKFNIVPFKLKGNSAALKDLLKKNQIEKVTLILRCDGLHVQFSIKQVSNNLPCGYIPLKDSVEHVDDIKADAACLKTEASIHSLKNKISKKCTGSSNFKKAQAQLSRKNLKLYRQHRSLAVKSAKRVVQSQDMVVLRNKTLPLANKVDQLQTQFRKELGRHIKNDPTCALFIIKPKESFTDAQKRLNTFLSTETRFMPLDKQKALLALKNAMPESFDVVSNITTVTKNSTGRSLGTLPDNRSAMWHKMEDGINACRQLFSGRSRNDSKELADREFDLWDLEGYRDASYKHYL